MVNVSFISRRYLLLASVFGVLSWTQAATAQDLTLPGAADPGRALGDLRLAPRPDETLEHDGAKKKAVSSAPQGTENLKFMLKDIRLEGMTAYAPWEAELLYSQYLGHEISVATLFEIMASIQQKYLDDGFALTKVVIPNQNIEGGNVAFTVIEGHVEEVEFGARLKETAALQDAAKRIRAMRPLNIKKLERIMLILNDLPDSSVGAILAAPKNQQSTQTGAVRLVLEGNEESESMGSVGINNHGSVFTGPLQANASVRALGLGIDHSALEISAMAAIPFQEQRIGSVSYSIPMFGVSGTQFTVSGSKARTEPGSNLSLLDIKGASESVEANISYPVIRQRDMTLKVNAGFEWKNSRTKILGEELYDDRLRILKAGLNFNMSDSCAGYNVFDVHYAQGLNVFGTREAGSIDLSRQDGEPDFKKFEFLAARLQGLPANFEALALVTGQYARDPLLSSEEFGFGGSQIGRGYDSSEITGDHGVAASFELRYNSSFNTSIMFQPYAFYDIGKVWNIDAGAKDKISAASAGLGVRFNFDPGWKADLNFARPMTKSADNEPKYQNDVGSRVLFSLSKSF